MEVHFLTPTLQALDDLKTEALCLPHFEEERPLRGVAGLVDWRLCGGLSRLLLSGQVSGKRGTRLMMPGRPRLAAERLLLLGAGAQASFDADAFEGACDDLLQTLGGLKLRGAAVALPGRVWESIDAEQAIEVFLDVSRRVSHSLDEVTLLDSAAAQKTMQPLVDRERRRAMAELD